MKTITIMIILVLGFNPAFGWERSWNRNTNSSSRDLSEIFRSSIPLMIFEKIKTNNMREVRNFLSNTTVGGRAIDLFEVNLVESTLWTPMHYAADFGNMEMAEFFKDYGIEFDKLSFDGTPLGVLCSREEISQKHIKMAKYLLKNGADPGKFIASKMKSVLEVAKELGHSVLVDLMENREPTPIINVGGIEDAVDNFLNYVKEGNLSKVKLALSSMNLKVNKAEEMYGWTPLYMASSKGHTKIVRLLLAHNKIEVNKRNFQGSTPLQGAAVAKKVDAMKLLLAHRDIDVNVVDSNGGTLLYEAVVFDNLEIVKLLLTHPKILVNKKTNGKTPLYWAKRKRYKDIAKLLSRAGGRRR